MATAADLQLLTGPDAADLLQPAIQTAGGELVSWTPRQVDHRPGSSTTVSYRARVRWASGVRTETLAARTGGRRSSDAPGIVRVGDGERELVVWRFPLDRELPGLAAACDTRALAVLLRSFGIEPGDLEIRTLAYRPGRRAVIRVATSTGALVIKAVRPSNADVDRSPDDVFAYATDPTSFSEWQNGVVEGQNGASGAPSVGARCLTTRRIGFANRPSVSTVTHIDPPATWGVRGVDGPIRAIVNLTVEAIGPNGPV